MSSQAPFSLLLPILLGLLLLGVGFWIWMLADCLFNETDKDEKRFKWSLGIALTNVIGASLYFFKRKLPR